MDETPTCSAIEVARDRMFKTIDNGQPLEVSPEQMMADIEVEENHTPIPEDDIEAIRAAIIKARTTEMDKGDCKGFDKTDKEIDKFLEGQKKSNEEARKKIMAMTDEELIAWAKDANDQYRSAIKLQKEFAKGLQSRKLECSDLDKLEDARRQMAKNNWSPDYLRRRFMRITNPNRKRGDPISKEPEAYHRFLKQCKFIREKMNFDKMSKLELKTRLIQTIAAQCLQLSDLQEKHSRECEADAKAWSNEVDKMSNKAKEMLSKYNCVQKCIDAFLEKHPGHREEYNLICKKVESELPKIEDQ